jgi:hypothetical protein
MVWYMGMWVFISFLKTLYIPVNRMKTIKCENHDVTVQLSAQLVATAG